jgi:GDPmannose 4,6-dehydratase
VRVSPGAALSLEWWLENFVRQRGLQLGNAKGKVALITGITGQDGSYLAEFLLGKGYEVHGLVRRSSSPNTSRIDHLVSDPEVMNHKLFVHSGDLSDSSRLMALLAGINPDEVYNLGAQSHVRVSFDDPVFTGDVTGLASIRLLEGIRTLGLSSKYYQASSSEMFGASPPPQNEQTPFYPCSPYGVAKVYSYWATKNYRESYDMFAVNGVLFNHESPRRGETFVTRKIAIAAARIKAGLQDYLELGNLDAIRDWGYAPEFVEAMWLMLQANGPDDYVLGTGAAYSVRDFVQMAFERVGLDWEKYVTFNDSHLRPREVENLVADASLASEKLGWQAQTLSPELAALMVDAEMARLSAPGGVWVDKPWDTV